MMQMKNAKKEAPASLNQLPYNYAEAEGGKRPVVYVVGICVLVLSIVLSGCAGIAPAAVPPENQESAPGSAASDAKEEDVSAPSSSSPKGSAPSAGSEGAPAADRESAGATESYSGLSSSDVSAERTAPRAPEPKASDRYEPVTAGVVDDNEQWEAYLEYLQRNRRIYANKRDVSERYVILVQDEDGFPISNAAVEVAVKDEVVFSALSDAGGRVLFHPLALDRARSVGRRQEFSVTAQKEWVAQRQTFARYDSTVWMMTLEDPPQATYTELDLLFVMDATGSMGDEIAKLKASMADIADQIDRMQGAPDVRYGLVEYRDRGDTYVVRSHDFTYDLEEFQQTLARLEASGGGDYPESVNEALHRSLYDLRWRESSSDANTLRLLILVADAPPHLDYRDERFSYDTDMFDAVAQGIKIFPVGASGLEPEGEYIFRQLAQFTGGKFVFLTYEDGGDPSSGPGTETDHDVENYSVNTLDKLIIRLVEDELEKMTEPVVTDVYADIPVADIPVAQVQPLPNPTPTPAPQPQPRAVSCTVNIDEGWNDCGHVEAIGFIDMEGAYGRHADGQALMMLTLDPRRSGYSRVRFDVTYRETPDGWTVNIGDSQSNNGYGGDGGDQSNDAEMQMINGELAVYGNDYTPARKTIDGHRQLAYFDDVVRSGETVSFEIANEQLIVDSAAGYEEVNSPYLYALARQPDREGPTNYDIFAAFNRTISERGRTGSGVSEVVITVYPR